MVLMVSRVKRVCLVSLDLEVEREYLDLQDLWDRKETQAEMDILACLENLDRRVSLVCLGKKELLD